jgi:hypothetical protein
MLPEGRLRWYIDDRADISASDDFAMLWVTGTDLRVRPAEVERLDGERIHIEDLCQAFRVQPEKKYGARSFVDVVQEQQALSRAFMR